MSWAAAVAGPLSGATCLWQDLDGLHIEPPPDVPPPTSILWGWVDGVRVIRVRLDGSTALVAVRADKAGARTLPWSPRDGRVAASEGRGPAARNGGVGTAYEQIIIDGVDGGGGPITFIRPARVAGDG